MILLHAAPITWGKIGGLQASIPALIAAQNRIDGVEAALAVTVPNATEHPRMTFPVFDGKISVGRAGRLNLPEPFDRPGLVVFHSTYIPAHATIAAQLRNAAIPYIVCPRGGLTRRSQATKRWKKKLGNLLFFNWVVANAAALHFLTEGEIDASTPWRRPRFVVGNGVEVPDESQLASPGKADNLRLLFIGRLHVDHKGLDMLLDACRLVRDDLHDAGARLELHGPDCSGSREILAERIRTLQLHEIVDLHGPCLADAKATLLKRADVFVHPSRTEGHPSSVLEAMSYGVPCLLTPNTNVAGRAVEAGAGWQVEPTAAGIAEGLMRILTADRTTLRTSGANARRLAVEQFAWPRVADQCLEQYRRFAA